MFFQHTRWHWAREGVWGGGWSFWGPLPAPWNLTAVWGHCTPGASLSGRPEKVNEWKTFFCIFKCIYWECFEHVTVCFRKGTPLKANEVRNIITEYVKKNELVHETNKKWVYNYINTFNTFLFTLLFLFFMFLFSPMLHLYQECREKCFTCCKCVIKFNVKYD